MRIGLLVAAVGLVLVTAGVGVYYFWLPHAKLRVTTGPQGSVAARFISAFASVTKIQHPRVTIELVEVPDLAASAKSLEDGATDLAVVRTDAPLPTNGQTVAILRRDVVALVVRPKSPIESIAGLSGKTVAIPQSPLQTYNEQALDKILDFFDVPPKSVKRVFLPLSEIGTAVRERQVAAVLAVGPIGPGEVVDVVTAIKIAEKGKPSILAIDGAEAFGKRYPGFESIDVPTGAFSARPPVPSDTVTSVAVTYRFAVRDTMLNVLAGAIARSIFTTKGKMMALTPNANQIEAPDPDDKNPILPVHPGVAAYLNSGEQSFFDEFQEYFYIGGMALTAMGSAVAFLLGHFRRKKTKADLQKVDRLIEIADKALGAQGAELDALESELNAILAWFVKGEAGDDVDSTALSVAIQHARHTIERRRDILRQSKIDQIVGANSRA